MPRPAAAPLAIALCLGASACYHAPDAALLDELRSRRGEGSGLLQCEVELSLNTDEGGGEFVGALLMDRGPPARVRLKLFPDLGGAAVDLAADQQRIDVDFALRDERFHTLLPPEEDLDASLPLLFAVTLWEHAAGLDPRRVEGVRESSGRTRLKLSPHPTGVDQVVVLGADGTVVEREFSFGWFVRWTLSVDGELLHIRARGLEATLRLVHVDEVPSLPDELFRLEPGSG